jgi:hypothetical protein
MATQKKVTRVSSGTPDENRQKFVPTADAKGEAKGFRMKAILFWILAIMAEIIAMVILFKKDPEMALSTGKRVLLIAILIIDLILLLVGSTFWKKANRYSPASKADGFMFILQNQLGVIIAAIAFVPVIILAFIRKEYLVGAIAVILGIGGAAGSADWNPPSQEEYAAQIDEVKALTGNDFVYWTKSGTKFHLYNDCRYINTSKTSEIFEGSVADARKEKNITELCSACKSRVMKEKGITDEQLQQAENAAKQPLKTVSE